MPESATHSVAYDRVTDRPADGEADTDRLIGLVPVLQMQNQTRPPGTITAPDGRSELFSPPHPVTGRQHD
jgi:hypothetical protein